MGIPMKSMPLPINEITIKHIDFHPNAQDPGNQNITNNNNLTNISFSNNTDINLPNSIDNSMAKLLK